MDVGCWGVIFDQLRDYCCQIGSLEFQHLDADFSTSETCITGDKFKRRCSKSLFWREQLNGEIVKREWLCYSPSTKKLYCFVCKLFASDSEKIILASVGYGDWKHAPRDLARHESTNKHLKARLQLLTVLFSFSAILVCFIDAQIHSCFREKMSGFKRQ